MAFGLGTYNQTIRDRNAQTAYENDLERIAREKLMLQSGLSSSFGPRTTTTGSVSGGAAGTSSVGGGTVGGTYSPTTYSMPSAPGVNVSVPDLPSNLQSTAEQLRYDPWSQYRGEAAGELGGTIGEGSPSDIYQQRLAQMVSGEFTPDDPSYQWRYQQGQQAAERSLAAKGLLNSGNALIELQQYGQGMASQEYGAQFDRLLQGLAGVESAYDTQMGRLMKMAGVDIDPTAGGKLNVAQQQIGLGQIGAGIDAARLGLQSQELANQYNVDMNKLALLSQNQGSSGSAATSAAWASLFGGNSSGGTSQVTPSWDEYYAARNAAAAAKTQANPDSLFAGYNLY